MLQQTYFCAFEGYTIGHKNAANWTVFDGEPYIDINGNLTAYAFGDGLDNLETIISSRTLYAIWATDHYGSIAVNANQGTNSATNNIYYAEHTNWGCYYTGFTEHGVNDYNVFSGPLSGVSVVAT